MDNATETIFTLHPATSADIPAIVQLDLIPATRHLRIAFVQRVVEAGECHAAKTVQGAVAGYAVLEHTFFDHGFVSMLYVGRDYRRKGAGSVLMRHLEGLSTTSKLFTSTNRSNIAMQGLLSKLSYVRSGIVENLDEGDPELVYVKFLTSKS